MKPLAVMKDGMPTGAERQILAELVNLIVAAAFTEPRRQDDLMGPATINARWRRLALAAHFRTFA